VGEDTASFSEALRRVLRQDPDVILVGEMRDLETIQTALTAAETGHLVFGTLHTQDASSTIDRVIDVFPPNQQDQIRIQLSSTLEAVVTQQLVPVSDGNGRCVAAEVLIATSGVRNLIRSAKTHQIYSLMQTGAQVGMQTMDQSLAQLVREGVITSTWPSTAAGTRRSSPNSSRVTDERARREEVELSGGHVRLQGPGPIGPVDRGQTRGRQPPARRRPAPGDGLPAHRRHPGQG